MIEWLGDGGLGNLASPTPAPVASHFFLLEIHWPRVGNYEAWIDGASFPGSGFSDPPFQIGVGMFDNPSETIDAAAVAYIDNVKLGTTRGGSDMFADDFESGTFAAWTHVQGNATIVANPFGLGNVMRAALDDPFAAFDPVAQFNFFPLPGGTNDLYLTLSVAWEAGAEALWKTPGNFSGYFAKIYGGGVNALDAPIYVGTQP